MARAGRPMEGTSAKRAPLNLKTSPELRERIERSAAASGLSLTQEVERRLEESYKEEDRYGGAETAALLKQIVMDIQFIQKLGGGAWHERHDVAFAASLVAQDAVRKLGAHPLGGSELRDAIFAVKDKKEEVAKIAESNKGKGSPRLVHATAELEELREVSDRLMAPVKESLKRGWAIYEEYKKKDDLASIMQAYGESVTRDES